MKKESYLRKNLIWIFPLFLIIIAFLLVFTFTRPALWEAFDFSNTGQIGDTIGGITAPLFNLIAAILIYISFNEQNKANKIQTEALDEERKRTNSINEFNQLNDLINQVKIELDNIELECRTAVGDTLTYVGSEALEEFSRYYKNENTYYSIINHKDFYSAYTDFLHVFIFTADGIKNHNYDINSKRVLNIKLLNLTSKFDLHLNRMADKFKDEDDSYIKSYTSHALKRINHTKDVFHYSKLATDLI